MSQSDAYSELESRLLAASRWPEESSADKRDLFREAADAIASLRSETPASECGVQDVIAWADGIRGAFGTEHASKITAREEVMAEAILSAAKWTPPDDLYRNRTMQGDEVPPEVRPSEKNYRRLLEESNLPIELAVEIADRLDALRSASAERVWLEHLLRVAIELFENDAECATPNTDAWRWLFHARAALDGAAKREGQ